MTRKADAIIAEARQKSTALIDAIPERQERRRATADRIIDVCAQLLSAKPVQEPTAPRVSEEGGVRCPNFPAPQTLLNHYRELLRIWRDAYRKVLDLSAPRPNGRSGALAIADADLAPLDSGTKVRVQLMMAVLREQKLETDRVKKILRDQVPVAGGAPTQSAIVAPAPETQALRAWLAVVEGGASSLEVAAGAGVRVTRRARPGQIVMPAEALEAIRAVCRPPRPALEILPPAGTARERGGGAASAAKGRPLTMEDLE